MRGRGERQEGRRDFSRERGTTGDSQFKSTKDTKGTKGERQGNMSRTTAHGGAVAGQGTHGRQGGRAGHARGRGGGGDGQDTHTAG